MQKVARQLGRYHVLDRIAFGGMAEIFRALTFDEKGNARIVGIKQVLPHYAEDREFIDMLVDEARLVSMLQHQNIVEIFEVGHVDGFYFLAMEHVWGKDLRAVLERCRSKGTRIPIELSAYLLSEALNGLDSAHRLLDMIGNPAGLVHRDFSPSNILISYRGDIKICDFGIAKANFSRIETKTGVIKGKVKYMSPEQAFGRKLDHRSDLFSAGSVFYEMLTNEPPFMAKNEIDLIFLVRDAQIIPPTKRMPDIPRFLEETIYRSMARSRSARFQSAAEFRHCLSSYLRQRGIGNWRAELGRFMKFLYAKELAKERQGLSEYILDPTRIGPNLGQNLIADVLGRDAAYTKFNPYPTKAINPNADTALHDASTKILEVPQGYEAKDMMGEGVPIAIDDQATLMLKIPDDELPIDGEQTTLWSRLEEFTAQTVAESSKQSSTEPFQQQSPRDATGPTIAKSSPPSSPKPLLSPGVSSSPPPALQSKKEASPVPLPPIKPTLRAVPPPPTAPVGSGSFYRPPPPPALLTPQTTSAPPRPPQRSEQFGGPLEEEEVSTMPREGVDDVPTAKGADAKFVEAETNENPVKPVGKPPLPAQHKPLSEDLDEFPTQIAESSQPPPVHHEDTKPTMVASPEQRNPSTSKSTPRSDKS